MSLVPMSPISYTKHHPSRQLLLLVALLPLLACSPKVANLGYVDAEGKLSQITTGKSRKQDVVELLGSPSTTADFGGETWLYIAARQEGWGFMKPKLEDQKVTEISFDPDGLVTKVDHYNLKDRDAVKATADVTPTEGHKLGFFEQVLGNVGRFNKAPKQEAR